MVLDLKKVTIMKSLDKGSLYIVEQIPTYVEYSDQTNVLRKGTFSSYCQDCVPIHVRCFHFCCDILRKKNNTVAIENSQCHVMAHHGGGRAKQELAAAEI